MNRLSVGRLLACPTPSRRAGISQRFGERVVLDGVDLEVPAGRVIGLLGPNGAGKTTLMRILFGVLVPDAGAVEWRGRPADEDDRRAWGYMPQERGLYRDMRVLDLLVWLARLHGLDKATGARRAVDLLERLGLGDRGMDKMQDLSGGMAQRVQLAAAMVHEPDLLVLDEPFAGLDPVGDRVPVGGDPRPRAGGAEPALLEPPARPRRGPVRDDHPRQPRTGGAARRRPRPQGGQPRSLPAGRRRPWPTAGSTRRGHRRRRRRVRHPPAAPARRRPGRVLDAVRAHADVQDFAVESPSLSELFLAATGEDPRRRPTRPTSGAGPVSPWQSTRLVAARELREAMRRRTFWIVIGVLFVASAAAVVLPEVLGGGRTTYRVAVVDGSPALDGQLQAVADELDVDIELVHARRACRRPPRPVADDDADVAVVAGDRPTVIAKQDRADSFVATAQQVVGVQALAERLQAQGLDRGRGRPGAPATRARGWCASTRTRRAAGAPPPSCRWCSTSCC